MAAQRITVTAQIRTEDAFTHAWIVFDNKPEERIYLASIAAPAYHEHEEVRQAFITLTRTVLKRVLSGIFTDAEIKVGTATVVQVDEPDPSKLN